MSDRVYVLCFTILHLNGKTEDKVVYYSRNERDKFIQDYIRCNDSHYNANVKTYYAELQEVNMDDIINAVWKCNSNNRSIVHIQ